MERSEAESIVAHSPAAAVELLLRLDALSGQYAEVVAQNAALAQRVEELERRVRRSSRSSHQPPSSDGPSVARRQSSRPPSGRRRGGQPGHEGHTRELVADPDTVVEHYPAGCGRCGAPLSSADVVGRPERRQVWEVPVPRASVAEHRLFARRCRGCGASTRAALPLGVPRGSFGPNLEATAMRLVAADRLSHRAVCRVLRDLNGVRLGLGTISRILSRGAAALEPTSVAIAAAVKTAPVVNVDETSWKLAGQRRWIWSASTPELVRIQIGPSRSQDACRALLGPTPPGVVISDRWSGYNHLPVERRQICLAHLIRDCRAVSELPDQRGQIGARLLAHLTVVFQHWQLHQHDRAALAQALAPTIEAFDDDLAELAMTGVNAASTFAINLMGLGPALWTFSRVDGVEPTNNHAERCLRPLVIHRKTSYGNQTERGLRIYQTLQTAVQTLALRGEHIAARLRDAIDAHNHGHPINLIAPT